MEAYIVLYHYYIYVCILFCCLINFIYIYIYVLQSGALVEELNRVNAENKKLTEMLTAMCESYNALQTQLMDLMSKNPDPEKELSPSKKRKSESSNNISNDNNINIIGNSESSSTDEELSASASASACKKPREEIIKAKISRSYVRTEASDTSLVSLYPNLT